VSKHGLKRSLELWSPVIGALASGFFFFAWGLLAYFGPRAGRLHDLTFTRPFYERFGGLARALPQWSAAALFWGLAWWRYARLTRVKALEKGEVSR
jgi:hypothetical protein